MFLIFFVFEKCIRGSYIIYIFWLYKLIIRFGNYEIDRLVNLYLFISKNHWSDTMTHSSRKSWICKIHFCHNLRLDTNHLVFTTLCHGSCGRSLIFILLSSLHTNRPLVLVFSQFMIYILLIWVAISPKLATCHLGIWLQKWINNSFMIYVY